MVNMPRVTAGLVCKQPGTGFRMHLIGLRTLPLSPPPSLAALPLVVTSQHLDGCSAVVNLLGDWVVAELKENLR